MAVLVKHGSSCQVEFGEDFISLVNGSKLFALHPSPHASNGIQSFKSHAAGFDGGWCSLLFWVWNGEAAVHACIFLPLNFVPYPNLINSNLSEQEMGT